MTTRLLPSTLMVFSGSGLGAEEGHHRAVGDRVFTAVTGAVDRGGDSVHLAALMGTDRAERLEFPCFRLRDHRLCIGKHLAAADRDIHGFDCQPLTSTCPAGGFARACRSWLSDRRRSVDGAGTETCDGGSRRPVFMITVRREIGSESVGRS